jgi:hypothetical protein
MDAWILSVVIGCLTPNCAETKIFVGADAANECYKGAVLIMKHQIKTKAEDVTFLMCEPMDLPKT